MSEVTYHKYPQVITGGPTVWWVDVHQNKKLCGFKWVITEAAADAWIEADKAERQRLRVETFAERGTTNKETA
jgi:hypothetical protein